MSLFPHRELRYYSFGLKAGVFNLLRNGFRIGVKTSVGKITQPINWYTRFPEYYFIDRAISHRMAELPAGNRARILDIGSPKMLGLYLGYTNDAEITLSDLSSLNLDEYRVIWESLKGARGRVRFELQDARSLQIPDGTYDAVYAMSVIEHIEGDDGDSQAFREIVRVLKPGGIFAITVPFGPQYLEQQIIGVQSSVVYTQDRKPYFFQRIYDEAAFRNRLMTAAKNLQGVEVTTVWRKHLWAHRGFARLNENIRGALGFLNPLLSAIGNQSRGGFNSNFAASYGTLHSLRDVYGDIVMTGRKAGA